MVARRSAIEASVTVALDRGSGVPLHRQLYEGLREAVLSGRLSAGTRLPSSRLLASEVGVSRNTVMSAFLQLSAEGYLDGRVGSGTYVADSLPDDLLRAKADKSRGPGRVRPGRGLSRRGKALASTPVSTAQDREGRHARSGRVCRRSTSFRRGCGDDWRAGPGGACRGTCSATGTRRGMGR